MSKEIEKQTPVGQPRLVMPLPCPFCGSAAVLDYDDEDRNLAIKPFYKCSDAEKCRVFGPDGATESEALERWNHRPTPKRQLLCGWRGMAGGDGCILPLGHEGGHAFSDGSGSGHND